MKRNIGVVRWFTNTESQDKNYGFIKFLRGDDDLSPDDKIYFRKSDIVSTAPRLNDCVSFNLKSHWQERNINCWRVGKVIVLNWNDLPSEIILTYWDELNDDNKRTAFVKYFDDLPADKLADIAKNFPPDEIFHDVKDKPTLKQKLPAIVEGTAQSQNFNGWAKIILDNDFPPEIILTYWNELNDDNKRTAFVKYFDDLPADKLADIAKNLPPDEILHAVKDKSIFSEKIPVIIKRSNKKFDWAQCLLDNAAVLSRINVDEDVMIFFMYEAVKRVNDLNDLNRLIKLLKDKIDGSEVSPRVRIGYFYICAAFAEHYAKQRENAGDTVNRDKYFDKRDEFIADAEKALTEIFNGLTKKIEAQADNPAKKFVIPEHTAHILPPCTDSDFQTCSFCEAVTWLSKGTNYCPRLHRGESPYISCFRIEPNLELSAEDWSLIELTEKLKMAPPNHEFFTRIGGEFNRLNDLLERLKCRECGSYMQADKEHADWKEIKGINQLIYEHFAVFTATTFKCQHNGCSQKDKLVYLSYCWNCHEPIDSRDNPVRIKGYYLCNNCGAGYRDFAGNKRYAIYPGTICPSCTKCPKCGGQIFDVAKADDDKFNLVCTNCGDNVPAPDIRDITPNKDSKYRKYECSVCNHRLELNSERLDRQLGDKYTPVILAKKKPPLDG